MSGKAAFFRKYLLLFSLAVLLGVIIYFGSNWLFKKENEPTWRGIIPGQTTVSEVVSIMGKPDNTIICEKWGWGLDNPFETSFAQHIRPCWFAPLIYEYNEKHPDRPPADHQVYFRDGRVWMVIEDTDAYPFDDRIRNEEIVATYGWPSGQAWSNPYLRRHLIYCEQGVMFGINDVQAERVYYFEPTTIFCPDEFELYLTYDPPNPIKN